MRKGAWYVGKAQYAIGGPKFTEAQGERILWHVLEHLQYDTPLDYAAADGFPTTGRWLAIQQIKQLLGVSVA